MANFSQNETFSGLGTLNWGCPETGVYTFDGKISCPQLNTDDGASQVLVTIKKNGTTQYVGQAGAEGFNTKFPCTFADSIDMIFSSSAPVDQGKNVIKSTVSIYEG